MSPWVTCEYPKETPSENLSERTDPPLRECRLSRAISGRSTQLGLSPRYLKEGSISRRSGGSGPGSLSLGFEGRGEGISESKGYRCLDRKVSGRSPRRSIAVNFRPKHEYLPRRDFDGGDRHLEGFDRRTQIVIKISSRDFLG